MDHQKPTVLLIFGTFSLGGCGGQSRRPKLNFKNKDQMSTPNEYTNNFKSNLTCIFPSVRAKLKKPICPRTLCSKYVLITKHIFHNHLTRGKIDDASV